MFFIRKYAISIVRIFALLLFMLTGKVQAQHSEFGAMLGTSYYLGEINPYGHFKHAYVPAFGLIYRKNLNKRYSLKCSALRGKLKADDVQAGLAFNGFRKLFIDGPIYEGSGQLEFNFFPYQIGLDEHRYTPFVFIGVSAFFSRVDLFYGGRKEDPTPYKTEQVTETWMGGMAIPFGVGFKFNLGGNFGATLEWGMRKTYTDELDRIDNRYVDGFQRGNSRNNDWYNFTGFMITYKFRRAFDRCPHLF